MYYIIDTVLKGLGSKTNRDAVIDVFEEFISCAVSSLFAL
jgi:hypothetical protein